MKIANIIVAEQSIPNSKNGSWTQRLEYFLETSFNKIDFVICSKSEKPINSKSQFYYVKNYKSRIINKLYPKYRYHEYLNKIESIFKTHERLIICVIDNIKLLNSISDFIDTNSLENKITLLFYNCGYSYFLSQKEHIKFCKNIDEIIFLTKSAYSYNLNMYSEFTPEVSIINNPIDKEKFNTRKEKNSFQEISNHYKLKGKKVFLWLSHDRKKKGMSLILNAWKSWVEKDENCILLIVGAKRNVSIKNVHFVGQVSSNNVYKYYKLADVYLFSTLCKEGFGLSLSQAICSGCFCITSNNGGIKDYFTKENGIMIDEPNIIENWVDAMKIATKQIDSGWELVEKSNQVLTFEEWSNKFSDIFNKWQKRINC
jgi:glycosyltransferase involved in cell wall biosynthesis